MPVDNKLPVIRQSRIIPAMDALVGERRQRLGEIRERYGVARLDLFGSTMGEGFDPKDSDLDSQAPPRLFERYPGLKENLERFSGREVNLLMEGR